MQMSEPLYLISAPFTRFEECEKFLDYKEALSMAQKISKYARELQIQVRLFQSLNEVGEIGELVAVCQNGDVLDAVQSSFFNLEGKVEQKFQSNLGKTWIQVVEKYSEDIRNYRKRLTVLSEDESEELKIKELIQKGLLEHFKENMPKDVFLAVQWKFVDCAGYKNVDIQKPTELSVVESTLRKYYTKAYRIAGKVAMRERWVLGPSFQAIFEQFQEALMAPKERKPVPPELQLVPTKPRTPRKKKEDGVSPGLSAQLPLFEEVLQQQVFCE